MDNAGAFARWNPDFLPGFFCRGRLVPVKRVLPLSGFFVSFEGIDKSGKSTQARLLADHLSAAGCNVVLTREPGGTELGREIRHLLLTWQSDVQPEAEVLLFAADRAQHVARLIRPALAAGKIVIADRYVDSSIAYQGYGRGLNLSLLRAIQTLATGGLKPQVTIWVDVPVATARARSGSSDRMEAESDALFERVRNGYAALCAEEPARWVRVDGEKPVDIVFDALLNAIPFQMIQEQLRKENV